MLYSLRLRLAHVASHEPPVRVGRVLVSHIRFGGTDYTRVADALEPAVLEHFPGLLEPEAAAARYHAASATIFVVQELLTEDGRRGFWADRGTFAVVADALAALDTFAADPTMIESARALNRRTGEILEFRIGSSRA